MLLFLTDLKPQPEFFLKEAEVGELRADTLPETGVVRGKARLRRGGALEFWFTKD